jgi:hypothetical protein
LRPAHGVEAALFGAGGSVHRAGQILVRVMREPESLQRRRQPHRDTADASSDSVGDRTEMDRCNRGEPASGHGPSAELRWREQLPHRLTGKAER